VAQETCDSEEEALSKKVTRKGPKSKGAKLAYRPIGLAAGILAGLVSGAVFKQIWKHVSDAEPGTCMEIWVGKYQGPPVVGVSS
jgi:hypothetical protein